MTCKRSTMRTLRKIENVLFNTGDLTLEDVENIRLALLRSIAIEDMKEAERKNAGGGQ